MNQNKQGIPIANGYVVVVESRENYYHIKTILTNGKTEIDMIPRSECVSNFLLHIVRLLNGNSNKIISLHLPTSGTLTDFFTHEFLRSPEYFKKLDEGSNLRLVCQALSCNRIRIAKA